MQSNPSNEKIDSVMVRGYSTDARSQLYLGNHLHVASAANSPSCPFSPDSPNPLLVRSPSLGFYSGVHDYNEFVPADDTIMNPNNPMQATSPNQNPVLSPPQFQFRELSSSWPPTDSRTNQKSKSKSPRKYFKSV